jgi:hypothetical protein
VSAAVSYGLNTSVKGNVPSMPASVAPLLPKWEVEAGENSGSDILDRVDEASGFLSIVAVIECIT